MRPPRRYGTVTATSAGSVHRTGATRAESGPARVNSAAIDIHSAEGRGSTSGTDQRHRTVTDPEREPLLLGSGGIIAQDIGRNGGGHGRKYRWRVGDGNEIGEAFARGSSRRDNSKIVTTTLLLNYMIGSGIFNSAQVFEDSGIALATILYAIAGRWSLEARRGLEG